jgi:hypothetical protein
MHYRILGYFMLLVGLTGWGLTQEAKVRLAFQRNGLHEEPPNIWMMFADGKQPMELPLDREPSRPRVTPALSPDGFTLAFAAKAGEKFQLFIWTLDDRNGALGAPVRVTKDDRLECKFPVWSPTGKQLAYLATGEDGKTQLRVVNADGTSGKVLAEVAVHATPSWRADGQSLLYVDFDAKKKPVLKNVMVTGGVAVPIRAQERAIAASYSPDGNSIAALFARENGLAELWVIPASGTIGGKPIVDKITGAKSVCWSTPDTILFNAHKVGTEVSKALWLVTPQGGNLRGLTGFGEPKQVLYLAFHTGDLRPRAPLALDPTVPEGPNPTTTAPKGRVPTGPITIMSPAPEAVVNGTVPIRIIAQKGRVASIVLKINEQFTYTTLVPTGEGTPEITYPWETQQFKELDPARDFERVPPRDPAGEVVLPTVYDKFLRFTDGSYTITAVALNAEKKVEAKDTVRVTVQNGLPATTLPDGLQLQYRFADPNLVERYQVHGEGMLFGMPDKQLSSLFATLDARIRRSLVEVRTNGSAELRVTLEEPRESFALNTGAKEYSIPESQVSALYAQQPDGGMMVIEQQRDRILLPLGQIATPLPSARLKLGEQYGGDKRMWLVTDLLARESTSVKANHVLDAVERIGERATVRIRSTYRLDTQMRGLTLATTPTLRLPGERGSAGAAPPAARPGGSLGATSGVLEAAPATAVDAGTKVDRVEGVRFTWFDWERNRVLRIEDVLLYTLPLTAEGGEAAAPGAGEAALGGGPGGAQPFDPGGRLGGGTGRGGLVDPGGAMRGRTTRLGALGAKKSGWYVMRLSYQALPESAD